MPLGYTASFSTSHIRPYTGPAIAGVTAYGTGGASGARGNAGAVGLSGPSGPTGMNLIGTYLQLDPTKPAYNYYVLEFADGLGNYVTAAPRGLTGTHGPVWNGVTGATAYFYNTKSCDAPIDTQGHAPCGFTGVFVGMESFGVTYISPTFRPWGGHYGQSGATLSFRTIGVSGDLELYAAGNIGTGDTFDVLGISGPDGASLYGTVTLQSENEIAYLTDSANVKDAYGLTFNPPHPITSSGSGTTWGTVDVNFYNYSEHFYIHGNAIDGVVKDPFVIDLKEGYGNVHQIFAPFSLSGISAEFHPSKNPIALGPNWLSHTDWVEGGLGATAEFGEAVSVTLLIDGGPFGIEFSDNFYFSEDVHFTNGRDIVNCLSYDNCYSWFCTMSGLGFGASVSNNIFGSCCNPDDYTCYDYILENDCIALGGAYEWYADTLCENTPCSQGIEFGSCCLNIENDEPYCVDEGATKEDCQRFGGVWREGIPCSNQYPCTFPCGELTDGACCRFNDEGNYINCIDNISEEDCISVSEGYGVFQGPLTYCEGVNCIGTIQTGACCISPTECIHPVTANECASQGGWFQLGRECWQVDCDVCTDFGFKGLDEAPIFKQRIMSKDELPKLSGIVCDKNVGLYVEDIFKYVSENGTSSVNTFIPNEYQSNVCNNFNYNGNISSISICLGCDKNLLGENCISLVVPKGTEPEVADAFGGVAYVGKSCKEVDCKEKHGTDLIHTDMIVGKNFTGMNINTRGKCKLKDGTIIRGCDKGYCEDALGGIWRESKILPNQEWNVTPSGSQYRDIPRGPKPKPNPNYNCQWLPQPCECYCEPSAFMVKNLQERCEMEGGECTLSIANCDTCDSIPMCGRGENILCGVRFACHKQVGSWSKIIQGRCRERRN